MSSKNRPQTKPEHEQRQAGRIAVGSVRSNAGTVLDASATGLRIRGKLAKGLIPGSELEVSIGDEQDPLALRCELRWIQRSPLRGATFGVAFVNLTDEQRRRLFEIIRQAGIDTRCRWQQDAA